jgi:hypothetical protein
MRDVVVVDGFEVVAFEAEMQEAGLRILRACTKPRLW